LRLQANVLPRRIRVLIVDDWFETGSEFWAAGDSWSSGPTLVGASVVVEETAATLRPQLGKFTALVRAGDLRGVLRCRISATSMSGCSL
jgi:hypothetical protein